MSFEAFASSGGSASGASDVGATSSAPPVHETSATSTHSAPQTTETHTQTPTQTSTQSADPTQAVETPPWEPQWKVKVMDKEHEIPEVFRKAIIDAPSEKAFKEVFEKALGLDHVKTRFQDTQKKYQEVNTAHTSVMNGIQELREHYQRGDFDTFFQRLQIPEQQILQWVIKKAQYNQLPPEQRQVLDEKRSAEMKAVSLEKQTETYRQQLEAQQTQAKSQGLQFALEKPETKTFAQSFDERAGKPGEFMREVIKHGEYVWYASQGRTDLTPEQAIQQVMARYGSFVSQQSQAAPQAQPMQTRGTQTPAPRRSEPSIPNLAGRGSSSAVSGKTKFTSLDALKKHAAKMGAN
jgi:hypothetical protein